MAEQVGFLTRNDGGGMREVILRATFRWVTGATVALLLLGCQPRSEAGSSAKPSPSTAKTDQSSVSIDSVNYMHERSVQYTLYDLAQKPPKAIGGSIVDRVAAGGDKGCCINLPNTWRPGMMVRLDWVESDRENIYQKRTRDLEIPRYDKAADLYVIFYAGGEHAVDLVVSAGEPGNPEWRGKIRKTPWEQCVETNGRKPCFLALPKRFSLKEKQGFCTFVTEEKLHGAEENCLFAMQECIRDYEDETRCHSVLWGQRRKE